MPVKKDLLNIEDIHAITENDFKSLLVLTDKYTPCSPIYFKRLTPAYPYVCDTEVKLDTGEHYHLFICMTKYAGFKRLAFTFAGSSKVYISPPDLFEYFRKYPDAKRTTLNGKPHDLLRRHDDGSFILVPSEHIECAYVAEFVRRNHLKENFDGLMVKPIVILDTAYNERTLLIGYGFYEKGAAGKPDVLRHFFDIEAGEILRSMVIETLNNRGRMTHVELDEDGGFVEYSNPCHAVYIQSFKVYYHDGKIYEEW